MMDPITKIKAINRVLKSKFLDRSIPIALSIEVTSRCNANCLYCPYRGQHDEMSLNELSKVIKEASEMGCLKMFLTGGEPLIREDIGEIIDKIKKNGMDANINTNGFLIPEKIEDIRKIDSLTISIDGPKKIHEKYRGKNTFNKAIKGLKKAKEEGLSPRITSVITKESFNNLEKIFEMVKKLETPFNPQLVVQQGFSGTEMDEKIGIPKKDIPELFRRLKKFKKNHKKLVRPSQHTLDTMEQIYTGKRRMDCGRGRIYGRIEGKRLKHCARSIGEGIRMKKGFKKAWKKLENKPSCNYACCTGAVEMANIWNLDITTGINQIFDATY